ncbi:glycosyltransferase family 4 protein [Xanthobacter autotrophicus]|uniref:glycosyltransferase family 4 protein n=1 Tax=Xanthobacter autotrophicus TaxID=280 RepID=UPI003727C3AB
MTPSFLGSTVSNFELASTKDALLGVRVLIIVENLPVPFDRRVWQEALTLKAAGAHVTVICPTGKGCELQHEVLDGVEIYRHSLPLDAGSAIGYLREYSMALFHETRLAVKIFFRNGFDVIHACNPPDLIFLVALLFKPFGTKFIFDHHDINPELYEAKFNKRGLFWRLLVFVERLTFACADVSIATNQSYRHIAIERGRMDPSNVFVVRSGPDVDRIKQVPPRPSLKKGREFLVGYVGVMGDQEGIDLLLESVSYIVHRKGRRDIQFCLVGGGPSLESLEDMSLKMGLNDYVSFLGRIPDHDLFEVLSTADVCVNPDRVNQMNNLSTMNKILEYMAIGKPIVQYEVVEGRISAEGASLYAVKNDPVDFAEKIMFLLSAPDVRAVMGATGQDRIIRELSWQTQIKSLIDAYKTALKRR